MKGGDPTIQGQSESNPALMLLSRTTRAQLSLVAFVLERSGIRSQRLLPLTLLLASLTATATELEWQRVDFVSGERAGQPSVTVDGREGFVVTWQERDGEDSVLRFAVIDVAGAELRRGTIARGRDWFVNGADFPNLTVLDNGDWVSFYLQKSAPDTYAYDVQVVRSLDTGESWGDPVRVHRDGTRTEHGFVSMVAAGDDAVRLVWLDGRNMASDAHDEHAGAESPGHDHASADHASAGHTDAAEHMTLRSAALNRKRVPYDEIELDELTCACCQTDAVRTDDGMLVAYRGRTGAEVRDIQLVGHHDGSWSPPRPLPADGWVIGGCPVNGPALAIAEGRVAALWPTMANGPLALKFALADGEGHFSDAMTLTDAEGELGRVDLAGWTGGHWLYSRLTSAAGSATLQLALLDDAGLELKTLELADRVGGFPRLAVQEDVALVVWAEQPTGPGSARIGVARVW